MRKKLQLWIASVAMLGMLATPVASVRATQMITEDENRIEVTKSDKPYLALGEDLSAAQKKTVLGLMGVDEAKLEEYRVIYVNNEEEHKYLGDYIPAKEIGTRSLSSVLIMDGEKDSGIDVNTYNINYCTEGMYKNACATAGITDAQIIVAGPTNLSGTAALVGIFRAYQELTGEALNDEAVDAAMDELVTTGEIIENNEEDSEKIEAMVSELKQMAAMGKLDDINDITNAIDDAAKNYDLSLSESDKEQLAKLIEKIKGLDIDWKGIMNQAYDWAQVINDKYGDQIKQTVTSESFWDKVGQILQKLIDAIKSLF